MKDFQELFKENLEYISYFEIEPEVIHNQFVKSQTRYYLTVGKIDCPSGRIVVSDPLCYLVSGNACPQLSINIPVGTYPVEVSICRNEYIGIRMCTARLKIKNTKAVKYVCAESTEDSAVAKCSDGYISGFPVEAGMVSFCDAVVAEEYREFLNKWYSENERKNHYIMMITSQNFLLIVITPYQLINVKAEILLNGQILIVIIEW